jgi:transposase InsO family protein
VTETLDLKLEFITRLKRGERMTDLCREYGIARKTGHKLANRYASLGALGLEEQSRAPKHTPHKTRPEIVELVEKEKRAHPTWGPRKLKAILEQRLGHPMPAASTLGEILERAGLVEKRHRRPWQAPSPTTLRTARAPNDLWCIDYKGQFRLGDQSYCYPLTVTDQYSRYLLGCEGMSAISDERAREACERIFERYGLPEAIRSDNGPPFASTGLAGLTKLSVYWLRLGIALERIRPAHPEENGRHERMHRTLKRETTRPAHANLLQQQERFDAFVEEYNRERPHQALGMKRPGEVYTSSARPYPARLPELRYPTHDDVLDVSRHGYIRLPQRVHVYISAALAYQQIGLRELDDGRWLLSFATIDLGHIDGSRRFTPASNPPGAN